MDPKPSITSWTRLESWARHEDLTPGLQARVHDPLWLLARQWQLGEFTGADGGSPTWVRVRADVGRLSAYRLGAGGARRPYDGSVPLETLVEREPPDPGRDVASAAEGGLHFVRLLRRAGLGAYVPAFVAACPLMPSADDLPTLDARSGRAVAVLGRGAPHAEQLARVLDDAIGGGAFPAGLGVAPEHAGRVLDLAREWLAWWRALYSTAEPGETAWLTPRMEYRLSLDAPTPSGGTTLSAPEYHGGRLDWYDFVLDRPDQRPVEGGTTRVVRTVLPAPAAYPGMPSARWWEFEDARVDFGRVEAASGDLARLLVVQYASLYSNDWFLLPLQLEVGSVCRITSLVVADTFGERVLIEPSGGAAEDGDSWQLFRLSATDASYARPDLLFLAPSLPASLEGPPIEDVRFLRDEVGNLAWAVERTVESRTGRPLDRQEDANASREREPGSVVSPAGAELVYQLATDVPAHWFPLLAVEEPERPGSIRLRRAEVSADPRASKPPLGQLLAPGTDLRLFEEEVPREGIRVTRAWQLARWSDGSTHVWRGRRKLPGRGEGSAGLRFDTVDPANADVTP